MKKLSYIVFSIGLLLSNNIFPSEGGLWAVITNWPGCIVGTVASCCCLRMCCNKFAERERKKEIKHKYEGRGWFAKFNEAVGWMKYDHETGEWESTVPQFPDPPRQKTYQWVQELNPVTGRYDRNYRLQ